jgi:hypothetical protein
MDNLVSTQFYEMDWIAGNSLYKSSPYTRQQNNQQCMQLIFTIHNIEFHTQREITRLYNSNRKSHIAIACYPIHFIYL